MVTRSSRRLLARPAASLMVLLLLGTTLLAACQAATPAPGASATAAPAAETTFEKIKREKVVTVGFIIEPPYNFALNGQLTGGYPEALKAFFKTIAPDIQMLGVLTEFSALIPGLVAKRFDISGPGMNIRTTRCQIIDFGNPEVQALFVFVVKKGNPFNLHSFADVAASTAKFGSITGAAEVEAANAAGIPKERQVLFPDAPSMVAGIQAGRIDMFAITSLAGTDMIKTTNDPNLELVELSEIPKDANGNRSIGYVATGFRKEDKDMREAYNAWLTKAKQSGELLKIMSPFGFAERDIAPIDATADKICVSAGG
jgi:polar amino acid transport system substrate-binding protein